LTRFLEKDTKIVEDEPEVKLNKKKQQINSGISFMNFSEMDSGSIISPI
jgi:hypothetical protein